MKEEFVTHNQALALKELGFDESCMAFFAPVEPPRLTCIAFKDGQLDYSKIKNSHKLMGNGRVTAPLKSQAIKFLLNKCDEMHCGVLSIEYFGDESGELKNYGGIFTSLTQAIDRLIALDNDKMP